MWCDDERRWHKRCACAFIFACGAYGFGFGFAPLSAWSATERMIDRGPFCARPAISRSMREVERAVSRWISHATYLFLDDLLQCALLLRCDTLADLGACVAVALALLFLRNAEVALQRLESLRHGRKNVNRESGKFLALDRRRCRWICCARAQANTFRASTMARSSALSLS